MNRRMEVRVKGRTDKMKEGRKEEGEKKKERKDGGKKEKERKSERNAFSTALDTHMAAN